MLTTFSHRNAACTLRELDPVISCAVFEFSVLCFILIVLVDDAAVYNELNGADFLLVGVEEVAAVLIIACTFELECSFAFLGRDSHRMRCRLSGLVLVAVLPPPVVLAFPVNNFSFR